MKPFILILFFAISANAQTQYSPVHHIAYVDEGNFTQKSDKWVAKRKAKSERHHGPSIAAQFEQNMRELQAFGQWLDDGWDRVKAEFGQCYDVSGLSPSMVQVTIQAGPFPVAEYPPDFLAAGAAYYNGRIETAYWNVRSDISGQTATALYFGELRNWFYWRLTGKPREMWAVPDACH